MTINIATPFAFGSNYFSRRPSTMSSSGPQQQSPCVATRTFTVYLIRHGEAEHNVEEKAAKAMAKAEVVSEGISLDSMEAKFRIKCAQEKILEDPTFFDAPLSQQGHVQAKHTEESLYQDCIQSMNLPPPTEVFVSPLQRTLQTASVIFRDHSNVHVREELRERLTGRPADNRCSSLQLSRRKSFERFSFKHLRQESLNNRLQLMGYDGQEICDGVDIEQLLEDVFVSEQQMPGKHPLFSNPAATTNSAAEADHPEQRDYFSSSSTTCDPTSVLSSSPTMNPMSSSTGRRGFNRISSFNCDTTMEDSKLLAKRARKLFELLLQSQHSSVAVVTHKGYLRELERNCLGQPNAKEFDNCEVRIYQLVFQTDSHILDSAIRLK